MAQAIITNFLSAVHHPGRCSRVNKAPRDFSSSLCIGPSLGCLWNGRVCGNIRSQIILRVWASVFTFEKPSTVVEEIVLQPIREISGTVKLPGSKSLSNRFLLLSALSEVIFFFFNFLRLLLSN